LVLLSKVRSPVLLAPLLIVPVRYTSPFAPKAMLLAEPETAPENARTNPTVNPCRFWYCA
jgi:hypothetical protein